MDSGAIYVVGSDRNLIELRAQTYDSEDVLQELLEKYPNLLAGEQIDSIQLVVENQLLNSGFGV